MSKILLNPQDLEPATLNYVMQAKEDEWRKKYNLQKEVYIDAYDAIRLIQGVWGLWEYKPELGNRENTHAYKFSKDLFDRRDTLVNSFLFNNKLNAHIRLLPPHQDELAKKIRDDRNHFATRNITEQTYELWRELNLSDLLDEARGPEPLSPDRLRYYLEKIRGIEFYIAHDLLLVQYWYERYNKLFKEDCIMSWDDSSYNFAAVTKSKEFNIILLALDEERSSPKMSQSNYVDAIAFYLLWERLESFKKDRSLKTPLPVFFVSQPGTKQALKSIMDTKETAEMFSYTFDRDGQRWRFPVIREAQYFVLDAIFNYEDQKNDDKALHDLFVELRATFNHEIGDHTLINTILGQGTASAEKLGEKIDRLIKDEFFDKIWAKHKGYEQLYQAVEAHKDSLRIAKQESQQQGRERQKIVSELRRDTCNFELANDIMRQIFRLNDLNDKELDQIAHINVFSDLSMVRFSFTKPCRDDIQHYATEILNARGTREFNSYARTLLSEIMDGVENFNKPNGKDAVVRLTVGLAVLWVFKKYELITHIAERLNPTAGEQDELNFPNYHIPLLYAAAVCRIEGRGSAQLAKRLAECIEKKFSANTKQPSYKAWLGLAYVWWHIWNKHHDRGLKMPEEMGKAAFQASQRETAFGFLSHAQHLGAEVINHLRNRRKEEAIIGNYKPEERDDILEQRRQKYYYAINLSLFLVVLYGNRQDMLSAPTESLFGELNGIEGTLLWHSRYYDTCARYHYRRALIADNTNTFKAMLEAAARDNENCINSTSIGEGFDYNRQLKDAINLKRADGYKGWKQKSALIN